MIISHFYVSSEGNSFFTRRKGKGHIGEGIVTSVNSRGLWQKLHAGFILSFSGWPGSFRKVPLFLQHNRNQWAHLSQHTPDKKCELNSLRLLHHVFVFKDGMTMLLIGCSRDFIVSSTSKGTKIAKNAKIAGTLDWFSGLKTGRPQVTVLLMKAAVITQLFAFPRIWPLTCWRRLTGPLWLKIAVIIIRQLQNVHQILGRVTQNHCRVSWEI